MAPALEADEFFPALARLRRRATRMACGVHPSIMPAVTRVLRDRIIGALVPVVRRVLGPLAAEALPVS
jgi:hypothetical protein